MKVLIGLFSPEDAVPTIRALIDNGYSREDLSMMSSAEEVPEYLEGEQEEAAASGAALGAVTGGATGALGAAVASTVTGFENMVVSGLMATSVGSVIGAYLGSLYSVRAESQTKIDLHEELGAGKILIVLRLGEGQEEQKETAVAIMEKHKGEHIEIHNVETTNELHTNKQK